MNLALFDPVKRKYRGELAHWNREIVHLHRWWTGIEDWWGIRPPAPEQRITEFGNWMINAVLTMHRMRPSYLEELKLDANHFRGKRVLEVGCGPLVPILQFNACERWAIDPLAEEYASQGWPNFSFSARVMKAAAEKMPFPDGFFDAVISVNALDHVDDFEQTASEIQRVLKPGGELRFAAEYHKATRCEPQELSAERIVLAFNDMHMRIVAERTGNDMFRAMAQRFNLLEKTIAHFAGVYHVTWAGVKAAESEEAA